MVRLVLAGDVRDEGEPGSGGPSPHSGDLTGGAACGLVQELNRAGTETELETPAVRRYVSPVDRMERCMAVGSYKQFCPVAMAAEVLCTRWTVVFLREAVAGSTRFNELRRGVPRMSPALLSQRLKELEAAGIITRQPSSSEPGVFEYHLTEAGRELNPVVEAFGMWGQ